MPDMGNSRYRRKDPWTSSRSNQQWGNYNNSNSNNNILLQQSANNLARSRRASMGSNIGFVRLNKSTCLPSIPRRQQSIDPVDFMSQISPTTEQQQQNTNNSNVRPGESRRSSIDTGECLQSGAALFGATTPTRTRGTIGLENPGFGRNNNPRRFPLQQFLLTTTITRTPRTSPSPASPSPAKEPSQEASASAVWTKDQLPSVPTLAGSSRHAEPERTALNTPCNRGGEALAKAS